MKNKIDRIIEKGTGCEGYSCEIKDAAFADGVMNLVIASPVPVPEECGEEIKRTLIESASDISDVRITFEYEEQPPTVDTVIAEAKKRYPACTMTLNGDYEWNGDTLRVYGVGRRMVAELNEKVSPFFEEKLGRKTVFVNDDSRYRETIENMAAEPAPEPEKEEKKKDSFVYGRYFQGKPRAISEIDVEQASVIIAGVIFSMESRPVRNDRAAVSICISDRSGSTCLKNVVSKEKQEELEANLAPGDFILVRGTPEEDRYDREIVVRFRDIVLREAPDRKDLHEGDRRVELHLHTKMSAMDGINDVKTVVEQAVKWGHKAVAITDHGVVQAFPDAAAAAAGRIKIIYGMEGYLLDDDDGADYKSKDTYHIILLARTQEGLKNLYRLVSLSHIEYFYKRPRLPRSLLEKYREGLIVGSACEAGEVYCAYKEGKSREEIEKTASYYDYLEIQPLVNNRYLVEEAGLFDSGERLREINRDIYELGKKLGKPVCATTDAHYLNEEDAVFRNILFAGQGYENAEKGRGLYLRTTDEMLEEFSYLGEDAARETVIDNTNLIADMIDEGIMPVPEGKFPPEIEGAEEYLQKSCHDRAKEIYGDPLPEVIGERLDKELGSIIGNGYAVMYRAAQMLVNKSMEDGYTVGSRGSVGSSFAATMAGITEVNPLPPHYICPRCKYLEWGNEEEYDCGIDMPEKDCPVCGQPLRRDGFTIPFETFLGFTGEKEPDIDLNFAGEYQPRAHRYTTEIFGEENVYRAGTVNTVKEKTAYGFVKKYEEEFGLRINKYEEERLARGCSDVKRTTGQHPGGMIILPRGHEIYEFCPVQYPANKKESGQITTHFDFHKIDSNLLKLDILGHDGPTLFRHLRDMTGVDPLKVPLRDEKVDALFLGTDSLEIKDPRYPFTHGTFGIPEFGTEFTRGVLDDVRPSRFADLVRIAGFSHGKNVWENNAKDFIQNGEATIKEVISARDDIMNYLILKGLPKAEAFQIMEKVRKGKGLTTEHEELMRSYGVPEWYIESCKRIKYMFPRAHAAAYVMTSYRLGWFKVYYPREFYAAFFSTKLDDFNSEVIFSGFKACLKRHREISLRGHRRTNKEKSEQAVLEVALEMYARGYEFAEITFGKSQGTKFCVADGEVVPPFMAVSGIGETAAGNLHDEYERKPFETVEELLERVKISKKNVDSLKKFGNLKDIPESAQMTMF